MHTDREKNLVAAVVAAVVEKNRMGETHTCEDESESRVQSEFDSTTIAEEKHEKLIKDRVEKGNVMAKERDKNLE